MRTPETLHYVLLQARNPGDGAGEDEHRAFAEQLRVPADRVERVDVLHTTLDAGLWDRADVVLVGGSGEYSVLDDHPAIRAFVDFVAATGAEGPPMFASCFGFQALVLGLGGEVIRDPAHAEVGSYDLRPTPAGRRDALFGALPDPFVAQLGHQDRATRLPDGLQNLAESVRCPYQAVSMAGRRVYATQFHPELTWSDNKARFARYFDHYGKLFGKEEAVRRLEGHRPGPQANALMRRFVEEIVLAG
ncbi:MAG: type 1 glutamine amidotransferase [Alphaproteobacteria bacterium]|nr:type 1 glutamine amidotransferase [Alphaproteobacteria bacterium]